MRWMMLSTGSAWDGSGHDEDSIKRGAERVSYFVQEGIARRTRGQGIHERGSHRLLRNRFPVPVALAFDQCRGVSA